MRLLPFYAHKKSFYRCANAVYSALVAVPTHSADPPSEIRGCKKSSEENLSKTKVKNGQAARIESPDYCSLNAKTLTHDKSATTSVGKNIFIKRL